MKSLSKPTPGVLSSNDVHWSDELETLQKSYTVLLNEYLEQEKELSDQCAEKQAIVEHA